MVKQRMMRGGRAQPLPDPYRVLDWRHQEALGAPWPLLPDEVVALRNYYRRRRDCRTGLDRTEALLSSADDSSYIVSQYLDPDYRPRHQPESLLEVLAESERCGERFDVRPFSVNRLRQAEKAYENQIDTKLVGPFVEQVRLVVDCGDAWEANLGVLVAQSFRMIHRQAPLVH